MQTVDGRQVMLVVLTGDRGLCGGYNNFILKKVSNIRWVIAASTLIQWEGMGKSTEAAVKSFSTTTVSFTRCQTSADS
jgi:F0F1-type ATP synthase gamma subunit